MEYEVDVLAVGDESKSGDAIALRYGNFNDPTQQTVVVIDGGFKESGEKLVERIRNEYHTNYVDIMVATHPDSDHVSGLEVVLEKLTVGELWMHRPWASNSGISNLVNSEPGLLEAITVSKAKKSLRAAYELEKKAKAKGVVIVDPFAGHSSADKVLHVIGPSVEFYNLLLPEFEKGPQMSVGEKVKTLISEFWDKDELEEPPIDAVSARNNSSVIMIALLGENNFLFTGDAGVVALTHAANHAASRSFPLNTNIKYYQIPHHGSKRNLGPGVLDAIIGPIVSQGQKIGKVAFVSAAKDNPKHPSHRVKNAFMRRGIDVAETCGIEHCYRSSGVPIRPGWGPITYCQFTSSHEEEI